MASLNQITQSVLSDVDGALGFAVVDLSTGLLLSVAHNVPYFTQSYLDAVAAAGVELFRGKGVSGFEKLLSQQRGVPVTNSIKEVQMSTDKTYHFMSVVPGKPNAMVVLITSKKANLGMGWAALRGALPQLSEVVPG